MVWWTAAAFFALEVAVADRYGFHRDELYFVAAGSRPAFGYVDQPPLSPLLAHLTAWPGHGPLTIRILPALAGALVVLASGRFARMLGAGRFGQALAAVATASAPVLLGAAHLFTTTPLDLLCWSAVLLAVVSAVVLGRERAWLAAGVAAGIGLENKDLVVLLLLALGAGLLATGRRAVLASRWPWMGLAIACLLWLPNLIWQAGHGWPQLAMAASLHRQHSTGSDYATVLPAHLLYAGLPGAALLITGIVMLWREPELRFLVVAAGLLAAYVVLWLPGRTYYDAGFLPLLFAAGAVAVERRGRALRRTAIVAPPVWTAAGLAVILPVLPVADLHDVPGVHKVNYDLGETVGWPQLTAAVVGDASQLAAQGTAPTSIFTDNYGEAGALAYYGGASGHLPPVLSGHNGYWMWGPGDASDSVVLVIGSTQELAPYFAECRQLSVFQSPYGVDNDENGVLVSVCTGPRMPWTALWPRVRNYS